MIGDRLVEKWLPLSEANLNTAIEMSFRLSRSKYRNSYVEQYDVDPQVLNVGTPQLANLHPWPARRPTAIARLLTLASVLPASFDHEHFRRLSGLAYIKQLATQNILPILINTEPLRSEIDNVLTVETSKNSSEITVVDPMAGGGSIPLESLRLGFRTIAMEYNPVAYLILKATLEYPAKYGHQLYHDVRREANMMIEWAERELIKYYAEDALNYIIARGYRCPICGGLVPIIHSDKLGRDGPYICLMADKEKKTFNITVSKSPAGFEKLRCIYCETRTPLDSSSILRDWVYRHNRLLDAAFNGNLKAESMLEELRNTHILLVKQTKEGFKPCGKEDIVVFQKAYLDLIKKIDKLREYVPDTPIPEENKVFSQLRELGIKYWYQLFNPRQLLMLIKLLEYASERCAALIEEKGEYGLAVATYLAFGIDKLSNYNTIASTWHESHSVIRDLTGHYATGRKIDLGLEYCEVKRIDLALNWVYEPNVEKPTATHGGICPVLKNLCGWLNGLGDRIYVCMADGRDLDKVLGVQTIDIINVDPPYLDQHYYADFSEFFWQLLRKSLKLAIDTGHLFNRDKKKGRVELWVDGWSPILPTVPREGELISRKEVKGINSSSLPHTTNWYIEQMWRFFSSVSKTLRNDGVLIVWFTHSKPEAWEGIISALYGSGFTVSKAWTVRTEMAERRVAQTGLAFFTSLAIVARKASEHIVTGLRNPKELIMDKTVKDAILGWAVDAYNSALNSKARNWELLVMTLAGAIAGATKVRNPEYGIARYTQMPLNEQRLGESLEVERFRLLREFFNNSLYPAALYLGAEWLLYESLKKVEFTEEMIREIVASDNQTIAYLLLWEATRYSEEPKITYDFAEKICKVAGVDIRSLRGFGLIKMKNGVIVLFGKLMFEEVRGRIELLSKTAAGRAALVVRLIVESPIKADPIKAADFILERMVVSRRDVLVSLYLLSTANNKELKEAGITPMSKPFVEHVIRELLRRC
jgi:putative DNA methylase